MAIHRYAVFAHFEGAALTPDDVEKLTKTRSLYCEVVHAANPLKVSAGVSAPTLAKAVGALAAEVAKVSPDAALTSANAIEVTADFLTLAVGVSEVS